jgi:hypothetical protein
MILGLTTLGERGPTFLERLRMGGAHGAGGTIGGAATVGIVWMVATPVRTLLGVGVSHLVVVLVLAAAVAVDLQVVHWYDRPVQVDPEWRERYGHVRSYFYYGMIFGFGWLTFKPSAVFYSVIAIAGLTLPLPAALAVGGAFGFAHTMPVYPASYAAARSSTILFRGRRAVPVWRLVGAATSVALLALAAVTW